MKTLFALLVALFIISSANLPAQSEKVHNYLKMVAQGKLDDVKRQLPDLLAEYPDDPGVMLLHGVVIEDAYRALEIFERIIQRFPESEWSDQAYWRVVQFYAVMGDTNRATRELDTYRKRYPNSQFLLAANDVVRSSLVLARNQGKVNNTIYSMSVEKAEPQAAGDISVRSTSPVASEVANRNISTAQETPAQSNVLASAEGKTGKKNTKAETKPAPEKEKASKDDNATYGLQVGIYSTEDAAKAEMERFRQQRMRTEIMKKKVDGAIMYAVVIGNYSSKDSAEQSKAIVQEQCGCTPIIFKK